MSKTPPQLLSPPWVPKNGHFQTVWAALFARRTLNGKPPMLRERWDTPDGDFIDVDFVHADLSSAPTIVLFHGLEGSSNSHYMQAFADWAHEQGVRLIMPHFRGCSGSSNRSIRAYHSGDHAELAWMMQRLYERIGSPFYAAGYSLGGNVLLRYVQEHATQAAQYLRAIASICAPMDMNDCQITLDSGLSRWLYLPFFLRTLIPRTLKRLKYQPALLSKWRLLRVRTFYDFDSCYTAPVFGFASAREYYTLSSSRPHLHRIALPALLYNPRNDPFVSNHILPLAGELGDNITLWQPPVGGHVGHVSGSFPGHLRALPEAVGNWLLAH